MLRFSDETVALHRRRRFAASYVGSTLAAWFILSRDFTLSALGLEREVVHVFSCLYLSAQLAVLSLPDALAQGPRWAWLRVVCVMVLAAGGFIYGATSTLEVSPAWVLVLAIAHLGVRYELHRYRLLMVCFAALAPLLHVTLAARVTVLSFWVSVGVGVFAGVVLVVLGSRADETSSLDSDEVLDARELEGRRALLSRVGTAMAVHDQLSGLLLGVRLKVKRSQTWADVAQAVAALINRTREVLSGAPHTAELFESVRKAVLAQGASFDLKVEQHRPFSDFEEADVRDIVSEACLNAACAGPGTRVQLHVVIDAAGTSILCRGTGQTDRPKGNGRGQRNMRLRSWARGGTFSFALTEAGSTLRVSWPRGPFGRRFEAGTGLIMLLLGAGLALHQGRALAMAGLGALVLLGTAMVWLAERAVPSRLMTAQATTRPDTAQTVRAALEPPLARLERAHAAESTAGVGEALRELSATLAVLLAELERESMPLMPHLEPKAPRDARFVFGAAPLALFSWRLVLAVGLGTALLSLPVTVAALRVPAWPFRVLLGIALIATALIVYSVRRWAKAPWAAPLREATLVVCAVVGASAGALSADSFGPGWVLGLVVLAFCSRFPVYRAYGVLFALGATPLLLRLTFVPGATAGSLLLAALLGAMGSLGTRHLARQREALEGLAATDAPDEREAGARGAVVEGLSTAMELHDALGGELLKLQLKLKKAAGWHELEPSLRRVLARGDELLRGERRPLEALPEAMRGLAVATGRDVTVAVEGELATLTPRDCDDVWSLVRQFVVDAAGLKAAPLDVRLRVRRGTVELTFEANEALLAAGARPMRNVQRWLWARGGTAVWKTPAHVTLWWAHFRQGRSPAVLVAGGVGAVGGVAAWVASEPTALGVSAALAAGVFVLFNQLEVQRRAVVEQLEALRDDPQGGAGAALRFARPRIQPWLEAMERSRAAGDVRAVADAARGLGQALVETVRTLEELRVAPAS